jgi:hypothetical protein
VVQYGTGGEVRGKGDYEAVKLLRSVVSQLQMLQALESRLCVARSRAGWDRRVDYATGGNVTRPITPLPIEATFEQC